MADNSTRIVITADDKTASGIASAKAGFQQLGSSLAQLQGLAAAGLAAGLVATVKSVIDLGDQMNDLSQKVGINVKDLATWQLAASQSGTSIEGVAKGVKGLSKFMLENGDALKKAGVDATDANGALIQLADLFSSMPDGVEKTALAVKLFGKEGMAMIPMLNLGSAGLKEAAEKAESFGKKMEALAPLADKFNDQLAEFALHSKEAGMSIATLVLPGLTGMVQAFNDLKAGGERAEAALEFLSEKSPLARGMIAARQYVLGGKGAAGYSGPLNAQGLPPSTQDKSAEDLAAFDRATESFVKERESLQKARDLLGKEKNDKESTYLASLRQQLTVAKGDISEYSKQLTYLNEGAGKEFSAGTRANALALAKQIDTLRENHKMLEQREQVLKKVAAAEDQANKSVRNFGEKQDQGVEDVRTRTAALGKTPQEVRQMESARAIEKAYEDAVRQVNDELGKIGDIEGITEKVGELQKKRDAASRDMAKALADEKAAQDALNASWEYGAREGLRKYTDEVQNLALTVEQSLTRAFHGAEDALVQFVTTGKLNFSSLVTSIVADLARIQIRQSITGPLASALGGLNLFGGGGSSSGPDSFDWMPSPSFAGGGYTGSGSRSGGLDGKGGFMAVLHPNETVIDHASGGGMGVTVNIIGAPSAPQVSQRRDGNGGMTLDVIFERVDQYLAGNIASGRGAVPAAMASTYGVNRAAGAF